MNKKFSYLRVAAASPIVKLGVCCENADNIIRMAREAAKKDVDAIVFPELSICGYTLADLFNTSTLLSEATKACAKVIRETADLPLAVIFGAPLTVQGKLFNCAVVCHGGEVLGIAAKSYIPNYGEFYEKRWFESAFDAPEEVDLKRLFGEGYDYSVPFGSDLVFDCGDFSFGVEICEDLWATIPPSSYLTTGGAQVIFNLSASNATIGKDSYRESLVKGQSARCIAGYVYASAGYGESSTDLVFDGSTIIAENGSILTHGERFSLKEQMSIADIDLEKIAHDRRRNTSFISSDVRTIYFEGRFADRFSIKALRPIAQHPFVPIGRDLDERCTEIFNIQANALSARLSCCRASSLVMGISGGLDSTLAILVAVEAFDRLDLDRQGIIAVTMPGFGTTSRTKSNAMLLSESLGATVKTISIKDACIQHFKDIDHNPSVTDTTYENSQARERTQILMDLANKHNGLVLGTGDMSELALGWATYNGDHMSMYGVNAGVPKTLVKHLVSWFASAKATPEQAAVLLDIVDTPISPELLPADDKGEIAQKTEDLVGPYELHDFFLYHFLRFGFGAEKIFSLACQAFEGIYDTDTIRHWLRTFIRRFFNQQFKRSCMPDGPKVGSVNLSPRGDWRMPSDCSSAEWFNF